MVTDLEDIESAISEAAARIERAINNRPNYLSSLLWFAAGWLIFFTLPGFVWHSKVRYAVQYNTGTNKVSIQRQPHDCNFFFAPIGDKDCHYERQVSTLRWAKSTGGLRSSRSMRERRGPSSRLLKANSYLCSPPSSR